MYVKFSRNIEGYPSTLYLEKNLRFEPYFY